MRAILTAVQRHHAILVFLAAVFLARVYLADWNSFWSDELLSVAVYGIWNDSLGAMVDRLAENSIHPPLYQIALYLWLSVFGDSEVAARALSSLSMTLAALFIYLTLVRPHGRLVAFFAAAGFSVMSWPMYYALEARSYAQTALLVTVSSWALLEFLSRVRAGQSWRRGPSLGFLAVLVAANTGLMLTHYYNAFWIVAQGLFVLVFAVRERARLRAHVTMLLLVLVGIVPVAAFFASWGRVFIAQYANRADSFEVDEGGVTLTPVQLLVGTVIRNNLQLPNVLIVAVGLLIGAAVLLAVVGVVRRGGSSRDADWSTIYLAWWLVVPLVVTYAAFAVMGVERYSARYFIFSAPPLVPLLIIAIAWAVRLVLRTRPGAVPLTAAASVVALVVAVVPGGLDAATDRKQDWRGITERVVAAIEQDPNHRYTIVETGFGGESRARFYFERFSDDIRADLLASRQQENSGDFSALERDLPVPGESDRVVVMYLHLRESALPRLGEVLDARYDERYRQLNDQGRGFVVYDVVAPTSPAAD